MWVIFRIDSQRRRHYSRVKGLGYTMHKPLSKKSVCGAWSHAPEHARQFGDQAEAQLAAETMGAAIRRPGAVLVTTMAEALHTASLGWTRRNNRSMIARTGGR